MRERIQVRENYGVASVPGIPQRSDDCIAFDIPRIGLETKQRPSRDDLLREQQYLGARRAVQRDPNAVLEQVP